MHVIVKLYLWAGTDAEIQLIPFCDLSPRRCQNKPLSLYLQFCTIGDKQGAREQ